jgi:hypothetical protein
MRINHRRSTRRDENDRLVLRLMVCENEDRPNKSLEQSAEETVVRESAVRLNWKK